MNDYMYGHIDACLKLATTRAEFLLMVKKVTKLRNPQAEPYVIELLKDFKK